MSDDADSRTLPPSPRRLEEARKRGEVALSRDLAAAATLTGGTIGTLFYVSSSARALSELMHAALSDAPGGATRVANLALSTFATAALPTAAGALIGWLISAAVQLGWPLAVMGPKFDISRIFTYRALVQQISPKAAAGRTAKAIAKVVLIGIAAGLAARQELREYEMNPAVDAQGIAQRMLAATVRLFTIGCVGLVVLAILDYVIARRTWLSKMRMTLDEFKREHREQEGDPHVKRKRRMRARELAKRRLAAAVKRADVVLVNPTEYAVALAYQAGKMRAPKVLAKGRGAMAQHIRDLARKAGIPIVAEPPLTRAIYKLVPEDKEIPPALYQAVATVLAHVYRLRRRRS